MHETKACYSLSLCTPIITYVLLCSYFHFRANNTVTLAQQNADHSGEAKYFIRHLAALNMLHRPTTQEVLCDPWLTTNTTDAPSHIDLSYTLRKNWSPGANWHSALTGIRQPEMPSTIHGPCILYLTHCGICGAAVIGRKPLTRIEQVTAEQQ